MDYKAIPGFDKFEVAENGEVRNVKTKRETKPYHTSDKTGPMIHLLDAKKGCEARLSVLKLVKELFGTTVPGWDVDPDTIKVKAVVEKKPRLTEDEKKRREDAKAEAKRVRDEAKAEAKRVRDEAKTKAALAVPEQVIAAPETVAAPKAKKTRSVAKVVEAAPATDSLDPLADQTNIA